MKADIADSDEIEASKTEGEAEAADLENALKADIAGTEGIEDSKIDWMGSEDVISGFTVFDIFGAIEVAAVLECDKSVFASPLK